MADAGQMLSQLWGNGFLPYYQAGAQIAANLTKINQDIAANTFQNNLDTVKLAMQQSQQQFENPLKAWELGVHSENAETERMFANQKLNPNSLSNQLVQARINHLNGGGVRGIDDLPGQTAPSPSATGSQSNSGGMPSYVNPNASTGTASATGGPGVLPALNNGNPLTQPGSLADLATPVDVSDSAYHATGGAYVPPSGSLTTAPQASAQQQLATALQMASKHQEQFGQSYQDSLNPDNDASPDELESAQAIQKIASQLPNGESGPTPQPLAPGVNLNDVIRQNAGNPLVNPPSGQLPAASKPSASVAPAATPSQAVPQSGVVTNPSAIKPTPDIVPRLNSNGTSDGTGYKISLDADGQLVKQEYHAVPTKQINPATGNYSRVWKPDGEAKPIKVAQTPQNWQPQSDTMKVGDTTYKLQSFSETEKGVKTAQWQADNGDTATGTPVVEAGTDHVIGYNVKTSKGGTQFVKAAPETVHALTKDESSQLKDLYAQSKVTLNPDDAQDKLSAWNAANPKNQKNADQMSPADWKVAFELVKDHNAAPQKLADLIQSLQKQNKPVPAYYTNGLPNATVPVAPIVTPQSQGSTTAPSAAKMPSAIQGFYNAKQ